MNGKNFVSHIESAIDGTRFEPGRPYTLHEGRPLWVKYDLPQVAQAMTKALVASREPTMWRYRELLPIGTEHGEVSLGEGMTPLLECPTLAGKLGLDQLWIKDESQLPTGSFKSRGLAMAVTMAKRLGIQRVALPTAGNAGGAAAAYAARAGIQCVVFMPRDTPIVNQLEAKWYGAQVYLVDGLINDCGRLVKEGQSKFQWFDLSTLKEPYRIEGKKTMGLELAEQFHWKLPDRIFYPTGGGTGLIGMWKAFQELHAIGWLDSDTFPKMISVQSTGCCPIAEAYKAGERFAEPFENARTIASGLRVPVAVGDFMILDAVRESGGAALAFDETRLRHWQFEAMMSEGIALCPEAAACVGAACEMAKAGQLRSDEKVVIYNTGAAQKYIEAMELELPSFESWEQVEKDLN
jgi:threonine synthase